MSGDGGAGGTADPAWSCVGDGGPNADPPVIVISLTLLDPFTRLPRMDMAVRMGSALDLACTDPITEFVRVDVDGGARLNVPTNQSVYFEITPTVEGAVVPTLLFVPPRDLFTVSSHSVLTFTGDQLAAILPTVDSTWPGQPPSTLLLGTARDCAGDLAVGVSFSIDATSGATRAETTLFYVDDNNFVRQLDLSANATQTGATGMFGATELNLATVPVSVTRGPSAEPVASATVFTRDGWITQVSVSP